MANGYKPIAVKTKGLTELQKAFKAGETALEVSQTNPVLFRALKVFYDAARANLTKGDPKVKTGNLLRDLVMFAGKSKTVARAYVKSKGQHSYLVEYGHRLWRGGDSRKGQGHQVGDVKEHPYFRPALDATRRTVRAEIRIGLQGLLAKSIPGKPGNATD